MHTHTHTQVPTHTLTQFKQNSKFSRTHLVVSFFRFFFRVALRALRYELLPLSLQTEIDATTTACCFKRSIVCRPHRLTQTTRRGGNNSRTLMFLALGSPTPVLFTVLDRSIYFPRPDTFKWR